MANLVFLLICLNVSKAVFNPFQQTYRQALSHPIWFYPAVTCAYPAYNRRDSPSLRQQSLYMETILRADASHPDFLLLVKELNAFLHEIDGEEFDFYFQFNQLDQIKHTVILYMDDMPVACGAIKQFEPGTMEVKRMFTRPQYRGRGLAIMVLRELEKWATELGYSRCVLETGVRQPYAIALYRKAGYNQIPNYGQYQGVENSVCFEKVLPA